MNVNYNRLNLPDSVSFPLQGNTMKLEYLADGRRVRTTARTYGTPLVLPGGGSTPQNPVNILEEVRDGELVFRDGQLVELRTDGGYFSLYNDSLSTTQVRPYFYVTDYLGSVRMVCDGMTGAVRQSLEYLPSGEVFRADNYPEQSYMFCEKELVTMHGWNMYDSNARFQHSKQPRFSTMDPLAEWDYATSPYAYCTNDFVNLVDPWGLYSTWEEAHQASLNHPGSHVKRDWNTGNYFYYYYVDSDEAVTVHREFGIMGNPDIYGRPYIGSSITSFSEAAYSYGGGGSVSGDDWEMLAKIWKAENVGVSAIASSLSSESLRTAELAYLMTEKIDGKPITSNFIDWHASNLKYIKAAGKASLVLNGAFALYDMYEGYVKDGGSVGYHTARSFVTGSASLIGGYYGSIYGAKWGAVGSIPGAIAGSLAVGVAGSIGAEYVAGLIFDGIFK